jgi:hypothetical protein
VDTATPGVDQDLLRDAAAALLDGSGARFQCDEAARYVWAQRLRCWAIEIECGTIRPAARNTAVLIAKRILRSRET